MIRSIFWIFLCSFGALTELRPALCGTQESAAQATEDSIKVAVLAGEHGANVLKTKSAVLVTVRVVDDRNRPVAAAVVTLMGPEAGPGVVFLNGGKSQSVVTEVDGRATFSGMQPVGLGSFQLTATAAYDEHFASTKIDQTNFPDAAAATRQGLGGEVAPASSTTPGSASSGMSKGTKFGLIGGIAAAAAAGVAVALTHGKSSSSTTTISSGPPTVGAPH